jgi:iron uptake system component EfeO
MSPLRTVRAVAPVLAVTALVSSASACSSPAAPDPALTAAVTKYEGFVAGQASELLSRTTDFVALVKAGKVDQAKAAYTAARAPWERIEPVAETFGDLDPKIDGRADVVSEGMPFTGFHRLEKDLWVGGLQADSSHIADQLLTDVTEIAARASRAQLTPVQLANGAKELLDEVATGKVTGEEERYSHTDLSDFAENVAGSKAALDALRPALEARDQALMAQIDAAFVALDAALAKHQVGSGYRAYTALDADEVRTLAQLVDAVAEPVSKVSGVVSGKSSS